MQLAAENYPAVNFQKAKSEAAAAAVSLEKNSLMPSLDAAYQANIATYNNITGMNYPGQLIPISGPPSTDNFNEVVPGSAISLLMKWAPIKFGERSAAIEFQESRYAKELAGVENEILNAQYQVGLSYFDWIATQELIAVYVKNIERTQFNLTQVRTLVNSGIRPAVDSMRLTGELSKARSELIKLKNVYSDQRIRLEELIVADLPETEADTYFSMNLPSALREEIDSLINPLLRMAQAEVDANTAESLRLRRSWAPKLEFWGTGYARGSGIDFNGVVDKAQGWNFSRYNYGFGAQIVFPILDLTNLKFKMSRQEAQVRAVTSQLRQTEISLRSRAEQAENELLVMLELAAEIPAEFEAANSSFLAIQSRYEAGLVDYSELIQSQYELLYSEANLKTSYLNAWKALLKKATVQGSMESFLTQIPN